MDFKQINNKRKRALVLAKGIFDYNVLHKFKPLPPTELQINVTYRCNARCQMCHIWQMKPKNELVFGEWQKIMKDPIFKTIRKLSICGGEPSLVSDLLKLTKLFLDSMPALVSFGLVTNGLLAKKIVSQVKALSLLAQKRGLDFWVSVSLDGLGKTHERIRGVPFAFEKTKETILVLKKIQPIYHFGLNVAGVILRENLREIEEVEKWIKEHKISFNYQIIGFHKSYVNNLEEKERLDFKKEDEKYLSSLLQKLTLRKFLANPRSCIQSYYWQDMFSLYQGGRRTTPCPFVLDAFVLDSFGDIYYCLSERKIGNCRQGKSASQIYYDPENLAFRRDLTKGPCLKCNSGCFVTSAIVKDFKKFAWFWLTGKLGPPGVS